MPDALRGDTGQDFIGKKRIMISAPQAVVRVVGILIFKLPSVWHTVVLSKSLSQAIVYTMLLMYILCIYIHMYIYSSV